jgi:phage-related protein
VDGVYFFGTKHKKKVFNIKVAFEKMSESTLRLIKKVFDGKDVHPLWFAEAPYKVYEAKVTG